MYTVLVAQGENRLSFQTTLSLKYSIGSELRKNMQYAPAFNINYPVRLLYNSPVYSLEVTAKYKFYPKVIAGLFTGIAVVKNEKDPWSTVPRFFDRVLFPVGIVMNYSHQVGENLKIEPEVRLGYQFSKANFGYTEFGFSYEQSGGMLYGVGIGLSRQVGEVTPGLYLGYELNRLQNDASLWLHTEYDFQDRFRFKSTYHLLRLGFNIKF